MAGGVQRIVCVRVSVWVAGWVGGGGRLVCSNFLGNLADLFSPLVEVFCCFRVGVCGASCICHTLKHFGVFSHWLYHS